MVVGVFFAFHSPREGRFLVYQIVKMPEALPSACAGQCPTPPALPWRKAYAFVVEGAVDALCAAAAEDTARMLAQSHGECASLKLNKIRYLS
jgi:hypothetical protein